MFDRIDISVEIGDAIAFRFPQAVSISGLWVVDSTGTKFWDFISDRFEPAPVLGSSMQFWPVAEAPPEVLAKFEELKTRLRHELVERGPSSPMLASVVYGSVPAGYKTRVVAAPLSSGEYSVGFFSEQGIGGARFVLP